MLAEHTHPRVGGVEKHIRELNKVLTDWGHKIVLWAPKHDDRLPSFENDGGVDIYRVAPIRSKRIGAIKVLSWWFKHVDLIRSANLIHFHGSYPFFHWFFPFRLIYPVKPMFITYHGCGMVVPPIRGEKIRNRFTQYFMRGNICIGNFLEKWHRLKPTFVSYGGVNIPSDLPSSREKSAVYVGRLDEDTGVELYLQALSILKEKHDLEIPLTVCGDGAMRTKLEVYCSDQGINAIFKGFVDNPLDYLVRSQFAFVSGYLSILEAMASECFVFSVYKNRIKEDYLKLFPGADQKMTINSDSIQLAENIKEAWNHGETFRLLAEHGRDFACDQSWDRLAKTYLKLWENP
jgi:glycosyltransferase involved in cell wall biosynthesis